MGLGAVGVKAQVRIGGNTPPNPAAALDLNAAEGTTTGTKGLALPRVTLGSNTAPLDGSTTNIAGMLVYNTGGSLSTGVYYWDGVWKKAGGETPSIDTSMLSPVTLPNSIMIFTRGLWRLATYSSTRAYSSSIDAGATWAPSYSDAHCVTPANIEVRSNSGLPWTRAMTGTSVYVHNYYTVSVPFEVWVSCWTVN